MDASVAAAHAAIELTEGTTDGIEVAEAAAYGDAETMAGVSDAVPGDVAMDVGAVLEDVAGLGADPAGAQPASNATRTTEASERRSGRGRRLTSLGRSRASPCDGASRGAPGGGLGRCAPEA